MRMTQQELDVYLRSRARAGLLKPLPVYPPREKARSKYGNKPTVVCGEQFDSGKEAAHYEKLLLLEKAGKITQLRHHVRYPLEVAGIPICEYELDFEYVDESGLRHYEDVKTHATSTQLFRVKKRLMAALHGINVEVVL
jgi:hypothetical protein